MLDLFKLLTAHGDVFSACQQEAMVAFSNPLTLALVTLSSYVVNLVSDFIGVVHMLLLPLFFLFFIAQEQNI